MINHKTYCAVHDPAPGQCTCNAPTEYEQGYQAGLAAAKQQLEEMAGALSPFYLRYLTGPESSTTFAVDVAHLRRAYVVLEKWREAQREKRIAR